MNIRWNSAERRFEAEFSSDFPGDLEAVKSARFHTDGPPSWIWYAPSPGIAALNRLRENRPASGLTISEEALAVYRPLAEQHEKNLAVKAQLAEFKKTQKKAQKEIQKHVPQFPEGKGYITALDLPPMPPYVHPFAPQTPIPDLKCSICGVPVYFYELQDPPTCTWCEKISENKA